MTPHPPGRRPPVGPPGPYHDSPRPGPLCLPPPRRQPCQPLSLSCTRQKRVSATLRRVAETQGRGANTLRRVSPYPSMPPRGASEGRRGAREGIEIPFCAPFWGIKGALRPSGGWRDTLSCPKAGHRRGAAGQGRGQAGEIRNSEIRRCHQGLDLGGGFAEGLEDGEVRL